MALIAQSVVLIAVLLAVLQSYQQSSVGVLAQGDDQYDDYESSLDGMAQMGNMPGMGGMPGMPGMGGMGGMGGMDPYDDPYGYGGGMPSNPATELDSIEAIEIFIKDQELEPAVIGYFDPFTNEDDLLTFQDVRQNFP